MTAGRRKSPGAPPEAVELLRGGGVASTLLGSMNPRLRETHVTAFLGYIVARAPESFLSCFGFSGDCRSVTLERTEEGGRSDIWIETTSGSGVIEAKLPSCDPIEQALRYDARWHVLLTNCVSPRSGRRGNVRYVSWARIADCLDDVARRHGQPLKFLASDLRTHLEQHAMIPKSESLEVYAREINDLLTMRLFMEGWLYGCWYEQTNTISRALYFAPDFGMKLAREEAFVRPGISYVAKIETVDVATTWAEFQDLMHDRRGALWLSQHDALLRELKQTWKWSTGRPRSFAVLDQPHLAFAPPIRKNALQAGKGWLSKRAYSFADLFEAWGSSDK